MQLQRFIDALKADLSAVAELGDEATGEAANRLVMTLQASVGLRLLDALSEAALELNEKLPSGHVEVRLSGQDPELVFVLHGPHNAPPSRSAEEHDRGGGRPRRRLGQHLDRPGAVALGNRGSGRAVTQSPDGLRPRLRGGTMAFYPTPFGHAEVRVDRRDPRPPRFADVILRHRRRPERRDGR